MGVVEEQGATDKVREGGGGGAVAANSREREERTGQRGRGFLPEKRKQTLASGGGAERMSVWERRKDIEGVCARLRAEYSEQTGIVPPGQTGETRGGSHAEHYGYVSSTTIYYTLRIHCSSQELWSDVKWIIDFLKADSTGWEGALWSLAALLGEICGRKIAGPKLMTMVVFWR